MNEYDNFLLLQEVPAASKVEFVGKMLARQFEGCYSAVACGVLIDNDRLDMAS